VDILAPVRRASLEMLCVRVGWRRHDTYLVRRNWEENDAQSVERSGGNGKTALGVPTLRARMEMGHSSLGQI
jgi:hypothetical protein